MNEERKSLIARHYRIMADIYENEIRIERRLEEIERMKKIIETSKLDLEKVEDEMRKTGLDPKSIAFRYKL